MSCNDNCQRVKRQRYQYKLMVDGKQSTMTAERYVTTSQPIDDESFFIKKKPCWRQNPSCIFLFRCFFCFSVKLLEEIGFVWDSHAAVWVSVPRRNSIIIWIFAFTIQQIPNNILPAVYISLIVFLQEERLNELREYHAIHGDCNVPSSYAENPKLATWIKCQRRQYKLLQEGKTSNMTLERMTELHKIGFCWRVQDGRYTGV
jgi:hypothetical protein